MRKAIGVSRAQLFRQFVGESVLVAVVSLAGALVLVILVLPTFNRITGAALQIDAGAAGFLVPVVAVLAVVIGALAGLYPAFVLSAYEPVDVMKGRLDVGREGGPLRKGLVIAQFAVGIFS